jgi:general secretion pathway protein D
MRQIKEIIEKLDVHSPNETYRIHVVHLRYAPVGEMVDVLNGMLSGSGGPSSLSPSTGLNSLGRGSALGNRNGSFNSGFGGGYGSSSSFGGSGIGSGSSGLSGSSFGGSTSGIGGAGGGGGLASRSQSGGPGGSTTATSAGGRGTDFESAVTITADPATNSLIVSAAPQDYETLRRVIQELDVPRVQVFVQAIIVEVSVNRTKDIGVNFLASGSLGSNVLGLGSLNFGNLQTALGNPLGLTGLGIGLASGSNCTIPTTAVSSTTTTTTTSTITVPCDIALMTALQSDTHSNVLSAPTLLTADNEEAMIVVGMNVPFVGSSAANAGLPGQIFNSVDRQNVGITLDMIPQVSAGDAVKLDVYEEVSAIVPGTASQASNPLGPSTTITSASTSVLVQNHRTAVIGGLISTETDTTRSGVPYLSDIPVIGNLFSDNSRVNTKQNLLVFLTPHVVRTRDDLQALALDERQKYVRSLGRTEINNMPASHFQQLYQPSFNAPISPQQDLNQQEQPYLGSGPESMNEGAPAGANAIPYSAPPRGYGSSNGATPPAHAP